jgi:hypothetical protein
MRFNRIILFFIFQPICLFGQTDILRPCADFGKEIEQIRIYEKGINKVLLKGFNDKPIARYIVTPAFDPEYCFQLDKLDEKNYNLKVSYLRTNFWYSENQDTINAILFERKISPKFAEKIRLMFEKALDSINYRPNILFGDDGIFYKFSQYNDNHEIICGETWSPGKVLKGYNLVSICDSIVEYVKTGKDNYDEILLQIEKLIKDL